MEGYRVCRDERCVIGPDGYHHEFDSVADAEHFAAMASELAAKVARAERARDEAVSEAEKDRATLVKLATAFAERERYDAAHGESEPNWEDFIHGQVTHLTFGEIRDLCDRLGIARPGGGSDG